MTSNAGWAHGQRLGMGKAELGQAANGKKNSKAAGAANHTEDCQEKHCAEVAVIFSPARVAMLRHVVALQSIVCNRHHPWTRARHRFNTLLLQVLRSTWAVLSHMGAQQRAMCIPEANGQQAEKIYQACDQ